MQTKEELFDEMGDLADRMDANARDAHQLAFWLTLGNASYLRRLRTRIEDGTCPGEVEAMLLRIALKKD